jgi:hypothetical protein
LDETRGFDSAVDELSARDLPPPVARAFILFSNKWFIKRLFIKQRKLSGA